jgi:hypothetical protein
VISSAGGGRENFVGETFSKATTWTENEMGGQHKDDMYLVKLVVRV